MKKLSIIAILAAAIFASCSNEENNTIPVDKNELQIELTDMSNTRSGAKTSFVTNDQIGLFITGTGYTPGVVNYKTSDAGINWAPAGGVGSGIKLTGNTANVYAFYPTASTLSTPLSATSTFPMSIPATDDFAATAATDYLWGTGTQVTNLSAAACKSTLTFKHALSKVSFIINKSVDYPATTPPGQITQIKLSSAATNIVTNGTVVVSTGAFTTGTKSSSVTLTPGATTYINAYNATPSTTIVAYMLAAPVNYTGGDLVLTLTIDGKAMAVTGFPTAPDWSAYKDYQYTITVSPTELVVSSVTITAWAVDTTANGMTAN